MDAELEQARRAEPAWDELRERRVLSRVLEERARARTPRAGRRGAVAASLAVAAAVLLGVLWALRPVGGGEGARGAASEAGALAAVDREHTAARLALRDGSAVWLQPDADVAIEHEDASLVRLSHRRGEARYDVSRRPERAFVVRAGEAEVHVRGTRFWVRLRQDDVEVEVEEGRVEVFRQDRGHLLGRGETLRVRRGGTAASEADDGARAHTGVVEARAETTLEAPLTVADARELPRASERAAGDGSSARGSRAADGNDANGSDESATATPERARRAVRPETPSMEALLAQADEARRAGQLERAAEALRAAVAAYGRDPRVATALFTLGRVERARGRDRAAAEAFSRAYATAPHGSLAEDALAEAAVSYAAGGLRERARQSAQRYLELHPTGLYAERVRHLAE